MRLRVEEEAFLRAVPRVGLNLGAWTSFGADQLQANVLKNPGFEGVVDRAVVRVAGVRGARFSEDDAGLARPDGFWIGARFDVRTGSAAGLTGEVVDSRGKGESGLPELRVARPVPVAPGDVVVLTRVSDDEPPAGWTVPREAAGRVVPSREARPGSPGRRSIALRSRGGEAATLVTWLDSIGDRGGRMLPVEGPWRLALWYRATGSARLSVKVGRVGAPPMLSETLGAAPAWGARSLDFEGRDEGRAPLEVRFEARGGTVVLDDVSLASREASAGAFRAEVGDVISRLSPGFLRDWQGQLGDTLENRLAEPFARRASRYRPAGPGDFGYSIPELLDLCRRSGARPWIVAPPAFGDDEWRGLGRYLAAHARDLGEVVVELGNENWNPTFRPGGVADPRAHGELAARARTLLREATGGRPVVRFAVNGPHVDPARALRFAESPGGHDLLAVAPYVLHALPKGLPPERRLAALFAGDGGALERIAGGLGRARVELAVAEVNVHALGGDAPAAERRGVVAGQAAGTAVARRVLEALLLGARRQCLWSLAGYETFTTARELVPLFGLARDLGPTLRLRPSGLAMRLLNEAVGGEAYRLGPGLDGLVAVAFRSPRGWSLAAASSRPAPTELEVTFPEGGALPPTLAWLEAPTPFATNEEREEVILAHRPLRAAGRSVRITVPAYGLVAAGRGPA